MTVLRVDNLCKQYSLLEGYAVTGASFEAYKGELLALVGESGSGKTTMLRLIAGFENPDGGELVINDEPLANSRKSVPTEKRPVGMVFQDYALFPHLTVKENIGFGLNHWSSQARKARVAEIFNLVNLEGYEKKYPHQISGGQQQRTALARALAPKPSIVLLDEPFSNLDDIMKDQVREDVRKIIKEANTTGIFVTHDTRDALSTADRIAVLKEGKIQQIGKPKTVYTQPNSAYVASFFGKVNIIQATAIDGGFLTAMGFIPYETSLPAEQTVTLMIRPEDVYWTEEAEAHFLQGTIDYVFYFGAYRQVNVCIRDERVLFTTGKNTELSKGQTLHLKVDPGKMTVLSGGD